MTTTKPACIHCFGELRLTSLPESNYLWQCEHGCAETIDTGISTSTSITSFQHFALRPNGSIKFLQLLGPLLPEHVPGARVYMPQLFYHYIECTKGGCYNRLWLYCIAPYLDSPEVVDYILRSRVIRATADARRGSTGAMIFASLYDDLRRVSNPEIADYLSRTFDSATEPIPNDRNA
jgi:hypothetical protein